MSNQETEKSAAAVATVLHFGGSALIEHDNGDEMWVGCARGSGAAFVKECLELIGELTKLVAELSDDTPEQLEEEIGQLLAKVVARENGGPQTTTEPSDTIAAQLSPLEAVLIAQLRDELARLPEGAPDRVRMATNAAFVALWPYDGPIFPPEPVQDLGTAAAAPLLRGHSFVPAGYTPPPVPGAGPVSAGRPVSISDLMARPSLPSRAFPCEPDWPCLRPGCALCHTPTTEG